MYFFFFCERSSRRLHQSWTTARTANRLTFQREPLSEEEPDKRLLKDPSTNNMKVPYNHVHASGDILFAARGGKILSFSLLNGSHISTWKHPDLDKAFVGAGDNAAVGSEEASAANPDTGSANEEQERPVKRQKVDGQDSAAVAEGQASNLGGHLKDAAKLDQKEGQTQGKKNKKNKGDSGKDHSKVSRAADRPAIIQMKSSPDGKHLLAVSGSDKTLWVFGHDGEGHMTQLSHR